MSLALAGGFLTAAPPGKSLLNQNVSPLTLFFSFKIVLDILGGLYFHVNFRIGCQFLQRSQPFDGDWVFLWITLGNIAILAK